MQGFAEGPLSSLPLFRDDIYIFGPNLMRITQNPLKRIREQYDRTFCHIAKFN